MAYTEEMAHRLADYLKSDLAGFKYKRSHTQLQMADGDFEDVILINVISRNGATYTVAFYVGVVHKPTERIIAQLEGRKVSPYDRTVYQYSVNVRKQDQLPFKSNTWWHGLERECDFNEIGTEVRRFIRDFALPYHARFHDLDRMRESLVTRDGLSLNLYPFKQVLAIDSLLSDAAHVIDYCELLQREIDGGYHHDVGRFNEIYERLSGQHPDLFPEFHLLPRKRA